jgi:predicted TIM-barrel fold metal-dependent hydrolase
MDSVGIKTIIGLGGLKFDTLVTKYSKEYPGRFAIFSNVLLGSGRIFSNEFLASLPFKLEEYVKMGLSGIGEFPKDLGIRLYDTSGKLIPIDDPRLDPLYTKAGELGFPILWHTADPTPFFERVDGFNERFSELGKYPDWSYFGTNFPSKETLIKQKENVLKKHPETIVIGGHFDWMTDDLDYLGHLLDTYPNYYIEFGSILSELGRQPFTTRKFFIKYQDRILFGTDGGALFTKGWTVEKLYQAYFEFLETENEYIDYPLKGAINQGNWKIYGINLPDEVLEKIYYKNAEKILFGNHI